MPIFTVWIDLPISEDYEAMGPHNRLYYTVEAEHPVHAVSRVIEEESMPARFLTGMTHIWVNKVVMPE